MAKVVPFLDIPLAIGATEFGPLVEAMRRPDAPSCALQILATLGDEPIAPGDGRDLPIITRHDLRGLAAWLEANGPPTLRWFVFRARYKADPV